MNYRITTNGGIVLHSRALSFADAQLLLLARRDQLPMYVRALDDHMFDRSAYVLEIPVGDAPMPFWHGRRLDVTLVESYAPWMLQFITALARAPHKSLTPT